MGLYRFLVSLLALREVAVRIFRRDWPGLRARLALAAPNDQKPRIWVHAASNGELNSVKPIINRLAADSDLLVTANTDSGVALVDSWAIPNVTSQLAPLDLSYVARRMFLTWQVDAHITVESELWPHRILACPGPVIVLGGRLTERSAKGWRRFEGLARKVLEKVELLSAQDPASLERFKAFGLKATAAGPVCDLKAAYTAPSSTPEQALIAAFDRTNTWLAASTHPGEDETILEAHKRALVTRPDLKLILAPRHTNRAGEIAHLIKEKGLKVSRRSYSEDPNASDIYLADTMGEMHFWYALSGVTFVAGSLTDRGGHTPYEPAAFASAILHGPDTTNFKAAYDRLASDKAAICVRNVEGLSAALLKLADTHDQIELGQKGHKALRRGADIDEVMRDVFTLLDA